MAYQIVELKDLQSKSSLKKYCGWGACAGFLIGLVTWHSLAAGTTCAIVGLLVGLIISATINSKAAEAALKEDFIKRGHNLEFQLGTALMDPAKKMIAFMNLGKKSYDLYSMSDILGWEHKWTDKTTTTPSMMPMGGSRTNTAQGDNKILFKTNNPLKPLYSVQLTSHADGETWMARLGAIFNG